MKAEQKYFQGDNLKGKKEVGKKTDENEKTTEARAKKRKNRKEE